MTGDGLLRAVIVEDEVMRYLGQQRPGGSPAPAAEYPYTCEWCRHAPADHMAVYDYRHDGETTRLQPMLCSRCAHRVTTLPPEFATWWLFCLVPDDGARCEEG
jgi:hypothetical protein